MVGLSSSDGRQTNMIESIEVCIANARLVSVFIAVSPWSMPMCILQ